MPLNSSPTPPVYAWSVSQDLTLVTARPDLGSRTLGSEMMMMMMTTMTMMMVMMMMAMIVHLGVGEGSVGGQLLDGRRDSCLPDWRPENSSVGRD